MCVRCDSRIGFFPDDPAGAEVISRLTAFVTEGRRDEARALVEEAKARWPVTPYFWFFSALAYTESGETSAGLAELAVALGLAPDSPVLFQCLARIIREQGGDETASAIMDVGWSKFLALGLVQDEASARAAFYEEGPTL
ncbi:MAG: tetratricopeptide repeat protein [Armatimonadia bacterium]